MDIDHEIIAVRADLAEFRRALAEARRLLIEAFILGAGG